MIDLFENSNEGIYEEIDSLTDFAVDACCSSLISIFSCLTFDESSLSVPFLFSSS
jgi:hypothetical protein